MLLSGAQRIICFLCLWLHIWILVRVMGITFFLSNRNYFKIYLLFPGPQYFAITRPQLTNQLFCQHIYPHKPNQANHRGSRANQKIHLILHRFPCLNWNPSRANLTPSQESLATRTTATATRRKWLVYPCCVKLHLVYFKFRELSSFLFILRHWRTKAGKVSHPIAMITLFCCFEFIYLTCIFWVVSFASFVVVPRLVAFVNCSALIVQHSLMFCFICSCRFRIDLKICDKCSALRD